MILCTIDSLALAVRAIFAGSGNKMFTAIHVEMIQCSEYGVRINDMYQETLRQGQCQRRPYLNAGFPSTTSQSYVKGTHSLN